MAAGDWTATQRARQKLVLQEVFADIKEEYNNIHIAQEILNRQTASISAITKEQRCIGATLTYQVDCVDSVEDCGDVDITSCDWDADEHQSAKVDIDVDDCIIEKFKIAEPECITNTLKYIDMFSYRLGTALAKVEEKIAMKGGAFIDANARVPVAGTEYGTIPSAPNNDQINFPIAEWNLELISNMLYDARQNYIKRPYGISTGMLWVDQNLNARKNGGSATLKTDNGGINIAYDEDFGQLKQIVGEDAMYLIDPNWLAFWTYNKFNNDSFVDLQHDALFVRREKLPRLTYGKGRAPIYVDLYKKRVCGTELGDIVDKYLLKLPFGFFGAPDICGDGNTGILKFGVSAEEPETT